MPGASEGAARGAVRQAMSAAPRRHDHGWGGARGRSAQTSGNNANGMMTGKETEPLVTANHYSHVQ